MYKYTINIIFLKGNKLIFSKFSRIKGHILNKYFWKKQPEYNTNIFCGTVLSRRTVTIDSTYKPMVLGY